MEMDSKEREGMEKDMVMARSGDSVCISEEEFDKSFEEKDVKDTGNHTLKQFNAKGNTVLHTSMAAGRVIEVPWDVAQRGSCHLRTRQTIQRLIDTRTIVGVKLKPLKKRFGRVFYTRWTLYTLLPTSHEGDPEPIFKKQDVG